MVLLTSTVAVHRAQPADATNLYYTVDSVSGTTMSVYVTVSCQLSAFSYQPNRWWLFAES